jgi:hypothetical protein
VANPIVLQDSFDQGVKRDYSRDQLPKGSVWYASDLIPRLGAKLRQRGGWSNQSNDIAATTATASYVIGGIYAPFAAAAKNLAFDEDGRLYSIATNGTVTDIGAALVVPQNPVFHRDKAIITATGGATAPKYYDGTTLGNLAGSPPSGTYSAVFNDRTLLARSSANKERLWFSDPGDPTGWDTTNTYWDFTYPITGLAPLRTAILVFHESHTSRLRGTTPPPGSDFIADDPLWNVGCSDARSIAFWRDQIIFADGGGIHISDGAGYDDLTRLCGMKTYWQDTLSGYDSSSWTIAAGTLRDHYFFTVMNQSSFVAAAMIDLRRLAWWPLTNVDARAMWVAQSSTDELYFGRRGAARVGKLSTIFSPASGVKADGDGDAVGFTLETGYYRGKPGEKGARYIYVTDHLADYATDNPIVTISYIKTPEAAAYTTIATTLGETAAEDFRRLPLGFAAQGVAFKFVKTLAGDYRLNGISADVNLREGNR